MGCEHEGGFQIKKEIFLVTCKCDKVLKENYVLLQIGFSLIAYDCWLNQL